MDSGSDASQRSQSLGGSAWPPATLLTAIRHKTATSTLWMVLGHISAVATLLNVELTRPQQVRPSTQVTRSRLPRRDIDQAPVRSDRRRSPTLRCSNSRMA